MARKDTSETFPVSKNGKFLGYADERQLRANPKLKRFDKAKAAAELAAREQKEAAAELASKDKLDKKNTPSAANLAPTVKK